MALLDFFKRKQEKERFLRKRKGKEGAAVKREPLGIKDSKPVKKENKGKGGKERGALSAGDANLILDHPHFSEKSAILGERGVYVFKIKQNANKTMVKKAVGQLYGVAVEKVNVSKTSSKKKFVRGRWGTKPGYKKAMVYLKKGERIEF